MGHPSTSGGDRAQERVPFTLHLRPASRLLVAAYNLHGDAWVAGILLNTPSTGRWSTIASCRQTFPRLPGCTACLQASSQGTPRMRSQSVGWRRTPSPAFATILMTASRPHSTILRRGASASSSSFSGYFLVGANPAGVVCRHAGADARKARHRVREKQHHTVPGNGRCGADPAHEWNVCPIAGALVSHTTLRKRETRLIGASISPRPMVPKNVAWVTSTAVMS